MNTVLQTLARYGGVLVQPRATLAALSIDEGRWDGVVLGVAYLAGSQLLRLAQGLAGLAATQDFNGLLVLAQALGRGLLPPILVLFIIESLLAPEQNYRRGVYLLPLVVVAALARLLTIVGVIGGAGAALQVPSYAPEILGAVLCAVLVLRTRSVVPGEPSDESPSDEPPAKGEGAAA